MKASKKEFIAEAEELLGESQRLILEIQETCDTGYNPDTKEKDRTEAHKLLTAAGFPNGKGMDFEIIYQQPSENNRENATRFQNQISTVFSDIKFRLKPMPDMLSQVSVMSPVVRQELPSTSAPQVQTSPMPYWQRL